jgi:hypothetical protein
MNGLILDDLQPSTPQDTDIGVRPSRASSQDVKHTHAKNVEDLDSDDYVV